MIKKFLLSVLISISFLCFFSGSLAYADTYGDYEYKVLSNGTVEITKWKGTGTNVSIPREIDEKSVTSIGDNAFLGCSRLTSIVIPNSVTSIGEYAFYRCSSLTSIVIPSSVTSIGPAAFWECSSLTKISVDANNTVYDSRNNCNAIIKKSTNELIYGCKNTVIPNSVTSIEADAFCDCSGLTSIEIPSSVTSIESCAFLKCSSLTNIEIPSSVTSIGLSAFSGCYGLTSISVDTKNTVYDSRNNCNAIIEKSTNKLIAGCKNTVIPNSVKSIGDNAFSRCSNLTSIEIPNSVTSIGDYAFWGCSGLTSIEIPSSVISIDNWAFQACSGLTSIAIPKSVTSIGDGAFPSCSSLTSISVDTKNTVYDSRNNCNAIIEKSTNKLIAGCKNTVIPNSVTSIGYYAFSGCSVLTSIAIPNSVTSIESCAFMDCSSLTNIEIPSSVTSIGADAFHGCSGLTSIAIPNSVTSIEIDAFLNCSSLTNIEIPSSVTSIKSCAFLSCSSLKEVLYSGTEDEWNNITISDGNGILQNAKRCYTGYLTITLNPQNGSSTFVQHYNSGEVFVLPKAPTKDNYDFQGWYTGQNGTGTQYTASTQIYSSKTLYAYWTVKTYTITFWPENGSDSFTSTVAWGSYFSKPADPTKEGYNFQGWYTGRNGAGTKYTASTQINSNKTLYAYWTVKTYTITFYPENGSDSFTSTVAWGSYFSKPADPTKEGYDFQGWYTGQNGTGTQYTASTQIYSSKTLYAYWTVKTYTITFWPENGSDPFTSTVDWGSNFSKPADPTKEGYDFQGWYTGQNGTETKYTASTQIYSSKTLYAYWTVKTYTITFWPENGSDPFTSTVDWGSNFSKPADPTKEGYDFQGWYTGQNGTETKYTASTQIESSETLYAYWTIKTCTITFYPENGENSYTVQYDYGDCFDPGNDLRNEGYTFKGWYTEENGAGTEYDDTTIVSSDESLYAYWESDEAPTPVDPKIAVGVPMGYVTFERYSLVDKSSITVKVDGEVLSEDDYEVKWGIFSDDDTTVSFKVTITRDGKEHVVELKDISTCYDLNNYKLVNMPSSIALKNRKDHHAVFDALEEVRFQNDYGKVERNAGYYIIHDATTPIEGDTAKVLIMAYGGYSFGGEKQRYYYIPVTFTDEEGQDSSTEEEEESGNENGEEIEPSEPATEPTPEPATEPTPEPEPSNPVQPIIPEKESRLTIEASGMGYHATVSMNNPIPYSKSKKTLAGSLDMKCKVTDADGNSTGIYVKSVKATKAKNGFTKATVKLKGSNKIEKKAAKQMNRQLKKIRVDVE